VGSDSFGDAIRFVDNEDLIRSDPFILTSCNTISNFELEPKLAIYEQNKRNEGLMTCIFQPTNSNSLSLNPSALLDDPVVVIDSTTHQILYYDDQIEDGEVNIPYNLLLEKVPSNLSIHSNFQTSYFSICSPQLILKLSDNFDFVDFYQDFVYNEVLDKELGSPIFCHFLEVFFFEISSFHHLVGLV